MANQCSFARSGRSCEDETIDAQFSSLIASKMYCAEGGERFGANRSETRNKVPAVVFIHSIRLIGRTGWHRGCVVQQAKKLPHGAEFKDTLQVGQFKDLRDPFRRIHQLNRNGAGERAEPPRRPNMAESYALMRANRAKSITSIPVCS